MVSALAPPQHRLGPVVRGLVVLAAALVVATACSTAGVGDDGAEQPAPSTPSTSSTVSAPTSGASTASTATVTTATETTVPRRGTVHVQIADDGSFDPWIVAQTEAFTAATGIEVNYTETPRETRWEVTTRGARQPTFHVVQVGSFATPQFGKNGWALDLSEFAAGDPAWDPDNLLPPVRTALTGDGVLYGAPLSADTSVIAYRQDLFEDSGLTLSDQPTWEEVASAARALHTDDVAGFCANTVPSWDGFGAGLTSVVNSFDATWWLTTVDGGIGASQVDQPRFAAAVGFYLDLLADAGPPNPVGLDDQECRDRYRRGEVAIWHGWASAVATSELGLDVEGPPGATGYARSPVVDTDDGASSWLDSQALIIPVTAPDVDLAWEYVRWASTLSHTDRPAPEPQTSSVAFSPWTADYGDDGYQRLHQPYLDLVYDGLSAAPVREPGALPRPGTPGVQYVGMPEFMTLGDECSEWFADVLRGDTPLAGALGQCHELAAELEEW